MPNTLMEHPLHCLILNIDFPPDTSAVGRVVEDLTEVLAQHHNVTLLAGRPSYDPSERFPYRLLHTEVSGNLKIERVGSTAFDRGNMRGRLANYLTYMSFTLARGLTIKSDVVIAMTSPPLIGLVGAIVARLWRCPLIYSIQDLHPDMAVAAGIVQPGLVTSLWDLLHRWVLSQAHTIVVLGEDMRDRVLQKGIAPERVIVVRNGALAPESNGDGKHPAVNLLRGRYPFVVLHAGNLGFAGAWETILEAARRLQGQPIGFVFVGDGAYRDNLQRQAQSSTNVRFSPFRPPDEVPYVLAAPDLHLVTLRKGLEGLVVPSKLYPILWSGRPVLAVAPEGSDVARIVRKYECGLVANPDDPDAVVSAVRWAYAHPEELQNMGRRAREAAYHFDRKTLMQQFVDIVEGAAKRQKVSK